MGARWLLLVGAVMVFGCSAARGNSENDAAAPVDGAQADASMADAPRDQATVVDAPAADAASRDAVVADASALDAAPGDIAADVSDVDARALDAAPLDAPAVDVRPSDLGAVDVPAVDVPAVDVPAVDVPAIDVPAVDVPAADLVTTDAPAADVAPVPCPSSAAGDGRPCADVGEGCAGGVGCGDSYACTCNSAHRWQCTTYPSTCDAGRDVASSADAVSACVFAGDYSLTLVSIGTVYLGFRADGLWRTAPTLAELSTATSGGDYATTSTELSIRETTASLAGCTATQTGIYRYAFEGSCATLRLTRVSDACTIRGLALDGAALLRR